MLSVAVIGCGRMGQMYLRALVGNQRVKLLAVCDPNETVATKIGQEFGTKYIFSDSKDVAGCDEIDAVIISTSTNTHKEIILDMINAGKHIFCEKPIAISLEDSERVLQSLEGSKVKFQLGFMRRFDPGYLEAKKLIEKGEIGEPVLFKGVSRDPQAPPFEYAKPEVSGDILMDLNIHDFDIAMWLMNSDVDWVFSQKNALVHKELSGINASDTSLTYLQFKNNTMGYVEGSRYSVGGYDVRAEILGSKGCIKVGYYRYKPVLLFNRNGMNYECVPWFVERFENAYIAQINSFVDCLINETQPLVSALDGLRAQKLVLAAAQSCVSKQPVWLSN